MTIKTHTSKTLRQALAAGETTFATANYLALGKLVTVRVLRVEGRSAVVCSAGGETHRRCGEFVSLATAKAALGGCE